MISQVELVKKLVVGTTISCLKQLISLYFYDVKPLHTAIQAFVALFICRKGVAFSRVSAILCL